MNRPKIALEPTMVLFAPVMTVECPYYTLMLEPLLPLLGFMCR